MKALADSLDNISRKTAAAKNATMSLADQKAQAMCCMRGAVLRADIKAIQHAFGDPELYPQLFQVLGALVASTDRQWKRSLVTAVVAHLDELFATGKC
jgi:hypothetical protein